MARHLEHFGGGLVTSRDPALLELGEMSLMQNMIYRPGDYAPARASGRVLYSTAAGPEGQHAPVRGLRNALFDNSDNFILAMKASTLSTAYVGDTGTLLNAFSFTSSASALDAIHYNDEWFLFGPASATDFNSVVFLSATATGQLLQSRTHGLRPNLVQVSTATGAGTWTAEATGYFEYWFTEVFEYVHDGGTARIEGTFAASGIPTTLFVSSTGMQASIYVPGAGSNPQAQKWILYRAGPKALQSDQAFPTGFKIAEGQFGTTATVLDGGAVTGSYTAANATASPGLYSSFTNPANVFVSDNTYATSTGAGAAGTHAEVVSFPTFSVTEPVIGIAVRVECKDSTGDAAVKLSVAISNDGGHTWSDEHNIGPVTTSDTTFTIDPGDTWGLPFSAAELVAGKFQVRLIGVHSSLAPSATLSVDYIEARVVSAGTKGPDESVPFPAIVIEASNVDAAIGSHGQPPLATTADIFQGCLVTNSRNVNTFGQIEKSLIRYSLPDEPDYFPSLYFLDFQTADNDEVTNLKTLNGRLAVFLKSRLFRVNYLPTEADADFGSSRGVCREEVSSQNGCVNAMCACVYEGPNGHSELAFVSDTGIKATDLFTLRDLTTELDWRSIIGATNSTPIALINDREHEELLFYYKNSTSGVEHYKCLHLSYNPLHIKKGGLLKISGPVHMRNSAGGQFGDLYSAWTVQRTNGSTSVFLGYGGDTASATAASGGAVMIESGTAIPASDSTGKLRSRRMYLSGMGDEFRVDKIFTYVASANTNQTIQFTPYTTLTNDPNGATSRTSQSRAWAGEKLFEIAFAQNAEGLELEVAQASNNQGHWAPQHMLIDWTDFGMQDSGKP